ncbi:rCG30443 [Rattus norvegicus]|uniref:RCG30443 n=1 Tax=Rattus norvegicus TaxID=10116 RepID=A6JFQ4_RAT|nr:rCG30443 [Rattus norvegicus]
MFGFPVTHFLSSALLWSFPGAAVLRRKMLLDSILEEWRGCHPVFSFQEDFQRQQFHSTTCLCPKRTHTASLPTGWQEGRQL